MSLIQLRDIIKYYGKGNSTTHALRGVTTDIAEGEMVAIMGPSGCGKSTLLNIIGCVDTPTSGKYILEGEEINERNFNGLSRIRNQKISFIFQNFALIKEFSVIDNVILPLNFRMIPNKEKKEKAMFYLEKLEIRDLYNKKVSNLSGGQQQRVAIARALAQESKVILADEPTGALDQKNGNNIMEIMKLLNENDKKTVILVTHDKNIASYCEKTLYMEDGIIIKS